MSPRLKEHHIKRGIAVLCAAAFLAQDMAWAAPQVRIMPTPAPTAAEVASSMVRFRLPDSVGLIDDAWKAPADADGKDRLVVLVQDAHTNPSGQINLSRALGSILAAEPVGTVYTEGAQGDVSLRFLRDRVSEAGLRTVLMAYLKKGIVKGDERAEADCFCAGRGCGEGAGEYHVAGVGEDPGDPGGGGGRRS